MFHSWSPTTTPTRMEQAWHAADVSGDGSVIDVVDLNYLIDPTLASYHSNGLAQQERASQPQSDSFPEPTQPYSPLDYAVGSVAFRRSSKALEGVNAGQVAAAQSRRQSYPPGLLHDSSPCQPSDRHHQYPPISPPVASQAELYPHLPAATHHPTLTSMSSSHRSSNPGWTYSPTLYDNISELQGGDYRYDGAGDGHKSPGSRRESERTQWDDDRILNFDTGVGFDPVRTVLSSEEVAQRKRVIERKLKDPGGEIFHVETSVNADGSLNLPGKKKRIGMRVFQGLGAIGVMVGSIGASLVSSILNPHSTTDQRTHDSSAHQTVYQTSHNATTGGPAAPLPPLRPAICLARHDGLVIRRPPMLEREQTQVQRAVTRYCHTFVARR